jgi:AcrR family transcriptional regulator
VERAKSPSYLRKQPRQRRARATFDAVVEAAARILAEEGAPRLTTNRIAERAGVSIGSLYQYFPDRAAIVRALCERELARAEALRPAILDDPAAPVAERASAAVAWHLAVHAADPMLGRALRQVVARVLPRAERERLLAVRAERVARSFGASLAARRRSDQVAFVLDACLEAVCDALVDRRPEWLTDPGLHDELVRLAAGYLAAEAVQSANAEK